MFKVYYIMGVSGCGKSTVGQALAKRFSIPFYDGDDFHPQKNIDKMSSGQALTDEDRQPWLEVINHFVRRQLESNGVVVACSALKESYREILKKDISNQTEFIHLQGSFSVIANRIAARNHFMPPALLRSQFDTLEVPKDALNADITRPVEQIVDYIEKRMREMDTKEIGLIGLGVMGTNLARNIANCGYSIALYNRHVPGKEEGIAQKTIEKFDELKEAEGFEDLEAFIESIERPRKIVCMITAGPALDHLISQLEPFLSDGDCVVDGGNSFYKDTERRISDLAKNNIHWIGTGISGGEEGALNGPSIMPGGDEKALKNVLPILKNIAAKNNLGGSCCERIGAGASGHFVKMVHNGIEYAEMQLIAEIYDVLKHYHHQDNESIANLFSEWNEGIAASYLLEITIDILKKQNDQGYLLDQILDVAESKGTGSWTTQVAAELGVAIPNLTAALNARYISMQYEERKKRPIHPDDRLTLGQPDYNALLDTYMFSRWMNHIQGFELIEFASKQYNWGVDRTKLAGVWLNGCIVRSELMGEIAGFMPDLPLFNIAGKILFSYYNSCATQLAKYTPGYIALPIIENSLSYYKSMMRSDSPANLIQAQRDYFGAHTYKRKDDPFGKSHHSDWS